MKNYLHLFFVLLFVISLTACGGRRKEALQATSVAATIQASGSGVVIPQPSTSQVAVSQPQSGLILFKDDFQDGNSDGWQTKGAWFVNQDGEVYTFGASGEGSAFVSQGSGWGDVVFRCSVRLDAGVLAINFRLTQGNRYLLSYQAEGLYLSKETGGGEPASLAQAAAPGLNAWHRLTIAMQGGHIQVYVDRVLVIDYTNSAPLAQGTVGYGSVSGAQVAVDDVQVSKLQGTLPAAQPAGGGAPVVTEPPNLEAPVEPDVVEPIVDEPIVIGEGSEEADLSVRQVELSNTTPAVNEQVSVEAVIENRGPGVARNFRWAVIPTYESGGPNNPVGGELIPALNPGDEITIQTMVIYPAPGSYTLRVVADHSNTVNDPVLGNSIYDLDVTVGGGGGNIVLFELPDLDFQKFTQHVLPENTIQAQTPFFLRTYVINEGNQSASAFNVRFYSDEARHIVGCSWDVLGLDVGQSKKLECNFAGYPSPGTYTWGIYIDEENEVAESDEEQNDMGGDIRVTDIEDGGNNPPGGGIDLTSTGASVTGDDAVGAPQNVSIKVKNIGTQDAGAFTVRFYPDETKDIVGCSWDITSLRANESKTLTCVYPGYSQPGPYTCIRYIDADNEINETNENNNNGDIGCDIFQ